MAHSANKRVYLTLNTVMTNAEADGLGEYIKDVAKIGIDAFIVADIGVLAMAKKIAPEMEIHLSTQVGIMNWLTAKTAYEMGAKRVVLAREMSLEEIKILRDKTPPQLEIEAFVHGAMCMSFSGRCLLSHYLTGRDANRGACAQPCRWEWQLSQKGDEKKYDIGETENGSYILNADDLKTIEFINEVCDAGVNSLKIEGRAKSFYYVASTTAAYRKALDEYNKGGKYICPPQALEELEKTSHRRYSKGFYYGRDEAIQNETTGGYYKTWDVMAVVEKCENGKIYCSQRGKFFKGDTLEILTPNGEVKKIVADIIFDDENNLIDATPRSMMAFSMENDIVVPKDSI
ncbi:MAG: U32 family peptidase C-terminal domain-containing protein, partial [Oscillospiraceae bacterium]